MKLVHESDKFLFPSTFQYSSMRFSCAMPKPVEVHLVTSIYFSGIGNVVSVGTKN